MKVHLIDINVSAEIDDYPSLRFQDIRKKPVSQTDTRTDGRENSIPPLFVCVGGVGYNKRDTVVYTLYRFYLQILFICFDQLQRHNSLVF